MLNKLFKRAASAASQKESSEMTTQETQPNMAVDGKTAEMAAQLATATEGLAKMTANFADMEAKYKEVVEKLSALETEKASLEAKAKEVMMAARKEKLEAVLGTDKTPAVLASLENADDKTFETVLSAFSANRQAEANSEMFTEAGVSAEQEATEDDPVARLTARIAANFKQAK